ncbi:bactofilin family protein [Halorarum salinum]|uniref:Polymer-forming cytoskeletal protein n=1 Tax=Halorarum salinum TaxID=2743089 RepID=A0A7D5Q895_9EURY|nr:polymer-forming cytoskeletal protein [Halobaculum salinum]QLG60736.1 polymer-forming cytoskeletal protein [Halobaculum salinum]
MSSRAARTARVERAEWATRAARATRVALAVALCALLAGGALVGPVASGGPSSADAVPSGPFTTVAVSPGETAEGPVTAADGRVVVAGTVEGDLHAYGGTVVLTEDAVVTGEVQAFGGRVVLAGDLRGPAIAYGGTVTVAETGTTREVNAGGETVRLAGEVGDATVLGATVVLAAGATVEGDLEYDARLDDRGGAVTGERRPTDALLGPAGTALRLGGRLPVLLPLLAGPLGVALARADPRTDALATRARDAPGRTLARGAGLAVGALLGTLLVAATVVGLPLLGLLVPVAAAGFLLSLAVATRAAGAATAARLPTSAAVWTVAVAVLAALVATLSAVGPLAVLALALWGAGAAAPRIRPL